MPVATIPWQWLGDGDSSKGLEYRPGARAGDDGEAYGDVDVYDQVAPISSVTLRAPAATTAQLLDLLAIHRTPADQTGSSYTAADAEGVTFTGPIQSISWRRIDGSAYWEIEIKIPNPVIVAA